MYRSWILALICVVFPCKARIIAPARHLMNAVWVQVDAVLKLYVSIHQQVNSVAKRMILLYIRVRLGHVGSQLHVRPSSHLLQYTKANMASRPSWPHIRSKSTCRSTWLHDHLQSCADHMHLHARQLHSHADQKVVVVTTSTCCKPSQLAGSKSTWGIAY